MRTNYIVILLFIYLLGTSCSSKDGDDSPVPSPSIPTPGSGSTYIVNDSHEGEDYWVVANQSKGYLAAYLAQLDNGQSINFNDELLNWPLILSDEQGNQYDFLGTAVSGPNQGAQLVSLESQFGYYFSLNAFFKSSIYPTLQEGDNSIINHTADWNIDPQFVFRATFQDAIPALTDPEFLPVDSKDIIDEAYFMKPHEKVIVVRKGNTVKAYPLKILDWHEVVNDEIEGDPITVSYCPLTGTSSVWRANSAEERLGFGVSGLLFNNNLILYDRATDSHWSQILGEAVNGEKQNQKAEAYNYQEVTWEALETLVNSYDLHVLSPQTGYDYDYNEYPYGDYRTNHGRIDFSLTYSDQRVPSKELVLGVLVNGKARIYRF